MSRTQRFTLLVASVALVVAVGVLVFYLDWSGQQRTQAYFTLIENQASAFSDRIALYLSRQRNDLLAATVDAMLFNNDVIYVQVVQQGEVMADERKVAGANLSLPVLQPQRSVISQLGQIDGKTPYLDVVKTLFPLPGSDQTRVSGYVRIGRTLGELEAQLGGERLAAVALGVGAWLVLVLGAGWGGRWLLGPKRREAPALSTVAPSVSPASPVPETASDLKRIGPLALDDVRKTVEVRGQPVELSPKEFDLLTLLCREPGKVYSNEEILKGIWAEHSFASAQDVKQYVYFLRKKLEENPKKPALIVTVRGFGYKISV